MTTRVQNISAATNTLTIGNVSADVYLNHVSVNYTSNATAGSRQVVVQVLDAQSNVLIQFSAGITQAASLTRRFNFMPGAAREAAFVNNEANVPIPFDQLVPAGGSIKVFDSAAIAAGDSMVVGYGVETLFH